MGKNYYSILHVTRTASELDIKRALRKLALIWHPDRNPNDLVNAHFKFDDICEAYMVLSDPSTRAFYDLHGEEVMKRGLPDGFGGFTGAWAKKLSSEELFVQFFGTVNPFAVDGLFLGSSEPSRVVGQIEPIRKVIFATLEEVYTGALRPVAITRHIINYDQKTTSDQETTVKVPIDKGVIDGTRIVFAGQGNQMPGRMPGDIEVEVQLAPHPSYRRQGNDLIISRGMYVTEALTGGSVRVPTLDGRTLTIPISTVVRPGTHQKVPGEGLASHDGPRGDLYIEFNVEYPAEVPLAVKTMLRDLLPIPMTH